MKKKKKNDVALEPIAEADRVPFKEKLAYGIGGLLAGLYGRRRREHDVLRYACVHDQKRHRHDGGVHHYDACKVLGRFHRPVYGFHLGQHARQVGKTQAVHVLWRHFAVYLHFLGIPTCQRMGHERRRIYGVYHHSVSYMEHVFDGHSSAVLLDGKRHHSVF